MIWRCTSHVPKEDVFPRLLDGDSTCSRACSPRSEACGRRSWACPRSSQVLQGLWSALPALSPAVPGAPRCTWRPLHRSSKLWDLTTLGFWSDNSLTLPEAPSDQNTLCWCLLTRFLCWSNRICPLSGMPFGWSIGVSRCSSNYARVPSAARLTICI